MSTAAPTTRESEDCLLARHPECAGVVMEPVTANFRIEKPCECECHRPT